MMNAKDVTNDPQIPPLRYQDQTPLVKGNVQKRPFLELSSPNSETEELMMNKIEETIQRSFKTMLPGVIETLKKEFIQLVTVRVDEAVQAMKDDVLKEVKQELKFMEERTRLHSMSQTELLEQYNRRDNVKVFGLPCESNTEGVSMKENGNDTIRKVIDVSNSIDAGLSENDISVAHRLPSRMHLKPVIVRFSRRVAKIKLLQNKKKLASLNGLNDVKIYEDITRPRMNFIKLMRSDNRVESVWTRDGTIFFVWKQDKNIYKIEGLFEGGSFMDYSLTNVMNCFTGVFGGAQQQEGT